MNTSFLMVGAFVLGAWCVLAGFIFRARPRKGVAVSRPRPKPSRPEAGPRSGGPVARSLIAMQRRVGITAPGAMRQNLQRKIERAGLQGSIDADALVMAQVLAAACGGLVAVLYTNAGLPSPLSKTTLVPFMVLVGAAMPFVLVDRRADRREHAIVTQFPDFLDLMALSVSAGLAFDVALVEVSSQIRGPLAEELDLATTSIALGTSRSDALEWLDQRLQIPALSSFVLAVNQAAELGSPIGVTLQGQAEVGRVRRRQLEEERIQKLPVKILLPTVLFIMPPTLLVVLGPAFADIMEAF